jgi:hypothetical protein
MKSKPRTITWVSTALLLMTLAIPAAQSLIAADEAASDSKHIAGLLQQARRSSAQLTRDSEELVTFQKNRLSWESHAHQLTVIKEHVNKIGKLEAALRDARESGSPWQQEAIDRVNPLLQELANNLETTINHLNKNQSALFAPPYSEYVQANAELATELHSMISDFVDYGATKAKFQALQQKVELAER